ncbi:MAG: hypothetical protein IJP82_01780 [Bacteroidaceae bacterium]|nr:hypothetical protein [Bacteroidaceae bacterium]
MKRATILILLMLIVTSTFAQPREIKRTDRLLTASGLPRYWKGKDTNTPFIEAFRYGGDKEAKRWWTGYYEPTVSGAKTAEKAQKKRERKYNPYEKKRDKMTALHPRYGHMFLAKPSFSPPYGFSYSYKDTALVALTQLWDGSKKHKKMTMTTHKMKVDVAIYDSIQCLHKLAVYTSAQFNPDYTTLDGTRYHFVWQAFDGDKYAISSDNGSSTCRQLTSTFNKIYEAINTDNPELLQSLMPTVHEILAHYRTLLLPDVPIDDWDLDASARKRKKD